MEYQNNLILQYSNYYHNFRGNEKSKLKKKFLDLNTVDEAGKKLPLKLIRANTEVTHGPMLKKRVLIIVRGSILKPLKFFNSQHEIRK